MIVTLWHQFTFDLFAFIFRMLHIFNSFLLQHEQDITVLKLKVIVPIYHDSVMTVVAVSVLTSCNKFDQQAVADCQLQGLYVQVKFTGLEIVFPG